MEAVEVLKWVITIGMGMTFVSFLAVISVVLWAILVTINRDKQTDKLHQERMRGG